MSRPLRIALVDDQDLVRTGFRMILDAQRDMCVVGQASDGVGALSMVRTTRPDVVLMDIRMPALDGIAATRAVLEADPGIKVIVLTTFDLDDYLVAAMRAGASGFLLKDSTAPELLAGIRAVARGDSVVAPSATRRLLKQWFAPAGSTAGPASPSEPGAGTAHTESIDALSVELRAHDEIFIAIECYTATTNQPNYLVTTFTPRATTILVIQVGAAPATSQHHTTPTRQQT
ncbi:MAG: response regulator transcription factor [Corynebacterium matruchotii]|uniref:response regulator n=1 Tax=Corynebacterium matruchotii TaxID=43768 RepID=UPI00360CEE7E